MTHYLAPDNSIHFVSTASKHLLPEGSVPLEDTAAVTLIAAKNYISAKLRALTALQELEGKVTPRMLREASLGTPPYGGLAIRGFYSLSADPNQTTY